MPRKLRVQYAGAIYHLMNRGDRREAIFTDDRDRQRFLETVAQACEKTGWQVQAYCLLPNHFHLVVETPQPNLVAGMKSRQRGQSYPLNIENPGEQGGQISGILIWRLTAGAKAYRERLSGGSSGGAVR